MDADLGFVDGEHAQDNITRIMAYDLQPGEYYVLVEADPKYDVKTRELVIGLWGTSAKLSQFNTYSKEY